MLMLTIVYDNRVEDIINDLKDMKDFFSAKNISIGISESLVNNTHFIKVYCIEDSMKEKANNMFDLYFANILYNLSVDRYSDREMDNFLETNYYFLNNDELASLKKQCIRALKVDEPISDENTIYYMNRKNEAINKIIECISERDEFNVNGFLTFRIKSMADEFEEIMNKVMEDFMTQKEYDEFIRLLKYFVEVQDCKMDEVNIIMEDENKFVVLDEKGNDVFDKLMNGVTDVKYLGNVNMDDLLISGLISNCPKKIVIHKSYKFKNKEIIDTIKNVFTDRVYFCSDCKMCNSLKSKIKV